MGWLDDIKGAISDAADAVGDAVSDGASAVADAAETVADKVEDGASWGWDHTVDSVETFGDGVKSAAVGVYDDVVEGGEKFIDGFGDLVDGKIGDAFKDWGAGLGQIFLQSQADAALMIGARGVSAVETLIGVEPVGRSLTNAEITELQKVYGNSLDYSKIRVKEGDDLMTVGGNARTVGNTIYIPDGKVTAGLLVHESGHVWQFQHGGDDYMGEALYAQAFGDAYDYEKAISEGKSWSEMDPEQQAGLLQNAYRNGYFDTGVWNGRPDLTAYMDQVVPQLRAGNGAT